MPGQVWSTNLLGGFMYSDNLSKKLRTALQPVVRFRQFCDAKEAFGLGKGDTYRWNDFSKVQTKGAVLVEGDAIPETNYEVYQHEAAIKQFGNSVPYTKLLDDLSEQPVTAVINTVLKDDARDVLDEQAYLEFDKALLRATALSPTTYNLEVTGTPVGNHTGPLTKAHVRSIVVEMAERNIPAYDGTNYMAIFRPAPLEPFLQELENVHQYVSEGWHVVMRGEKGRYNGVRFIEQTSIPSAGFAESDKGFFFGADTVVEALSIPEEIRAKIPTNYGLSRGIAWYALTGYALVHDALPQQRIVVWDSVA